MTLERFSDRDLVKTFSRFFATVSRFWEFWANCLKRAFSYQLRTGTQTA
jgi:hypothetical protein